MSKDVVGYVVLPWLTAYVRRNGRDFHLVLGWTDVLGLTATKRPVLRARARQGIGVSRRGAVRFARGTLPDRGQIVS